MRVFEVIAFIALSGALHAATLAIAPLQPGGSSGVEGGTAEMTLQAATPTLAAMVQDWDRAPEVSDAPRLTEPDAAAAPVRPKQDTPLARRPAMTALAAPGPAPSLPQAETRLPAPPIPLAQTMPDALPLPLTQRADDAPDLPAPQDTPRPAAPARPTLAETVRAAPEIDTTPPARRAAPVASLRPQPRPDRPAPRTAPEPQPAQGAAQPKQTAQGSGSASSSSPGQSVEAPAPRGPSGAQLARLEQQWGAQITSALRRAHRPPRGLQGTVQLVIAVAPAGQVTGVSLAASSGNPRLDQAALAAVRRARFPRAPEGLTKSSYRFSQRLTVAR